MSFTTVELFETKRVYISKKQGVVHLIFVFKIVFKSFNHDENKRFLCFIKFSPYSIIF